MKICVVGLGYIGLPTASIFANEGYCVVGVDVNKNVVDNLNKGIIHIEEKGICESINSAISKNKFKASQIPEEADVFIISVPTPNLNDEVFSCDLKYVLEACKAIIPYLNKGNVVIIESTIAPKSTNNFIKPVFEKAGFEIGKDLYLAHCPERVLPGNILQELVENDRIVGGITTKCTEEAANIYKLVVKGEIIKTEAKTAELSKCMENTFRDVNIALANELAKICYEIDVNCLDVIKMANRHPRVNIHKPGPGVGGHCLAIDPYFVYAAAPSVANIIKLSRDTNRSMPNFIVDRTKELVEKVDNPQIAIFGVTYKGNVDDIRESPAIEIVDKLKKQGYELRIFDEHVNNETFVDLETAVKDAHLMLVLSDHNEYKNLNHKQIAKLMKNPILFDTKDIISEEKDSGLRVINYGNLYKLKESK